MSRLFVVSNRVQRPTGGVSANQGGLAVALIAALREHGGTWFGWSGETVAAFTGIVHREHDGDTETATVDLDLRDREEYYDGYSNRTLWPLLHYRVDLSAFDRNFEAGYARVNRRFADVARPLIGADDLVWVHDYHLLPFGGELRARGVANRMGFFLHVPWPPPDLLLSLPESRALVEALFAYDLVAFQAADWLTNFVQFVTDQLGGVREGEEAIRLGDRRIRVMVAPIGIDAAAFEAEATGSAARFTQERMYMSATGRSLIVGVDRLDYSKGLPERFAGYERFLHTYADLRGLVYMLQIAPPSRETVDAYQAIRAELDAMSGRINGEYADIDWVPIRYVNKGFSRAHLAGIYRAALIGLVTPLRDGMNLVAKEFVAAQDPADPGVLVLSRFAGAATQLKDALLVNPHSSDEMAEAIHRALTMPLAERKRRWQSLIDVVRGEDVFWWRDRFVAALEGLPARAI